MIATIAGKTPTIALSTSSPTWKAKSSTTRRAEGSYIKFGGGSIQARTGFIRARPSVALGGWGTSGRIPDLLPWPGFVAAWRIASVLAGILVLAGLAITWENVRVPSVLLATTTSTRDSGLLDYLLSHFLEDSGISVRYIAVGTGQALDAGRRGDADVVLVHAPVAELTFMAEGHGLCRSPVMRNEFVVVGPRSDPAGIRGLTNATEAFRRIYGSESPFVSRGDNSGTHLMEKLIWSWVGVQPTSSDPWYKESGQGMGPTLIMASELGAYTLTDDGTFFVRVSSLALEIDVSTDPPLQNHYSVIPADPSRHPGVFVAGAVSFAKWIVSARGQTLIASYTIGGHQPFHPTGEDQC